MLPLLFLILLAAILAVVWFASATRAPDEPLVGLTQDEITRRAIALAQNDFDGTPFNVDVQSSTVGELQTVECSALGKWLSTITESLRGRPNWCMSDTRVWIVTLRGNFSQNGFTTDTLKVLLDSSGGFLSLNSGELAQPNW